MTSDPEAVATALAAAFLDGVWGSPESLAGRGSDAVDVSPRRLRATAVAVLVAYQRPPRDRPRELAAFIGQLASFDGLWRGPRPRVRRHPVPVVRMAPSRWPVLRLDDVGDLADWAELTVGQLEWYADAKSWERRAAASLRHYDRTWRYNRRGTVRLLERPRPRLKALQRRVLGEIVGMIPPHAAAHGFVASRSVMTYAAPHVDRDVVVHLDLEAFFATVVAGRVFGVLRTAGYAEPVAHSLTGLVTTVLPYEDRRLAPQALRDGDLESRRRLLERLIRPHLPQGSPTSPALANLVAYRLDARLSRLAGLADAVYTRYADDLAFSFTGPQASRRARRFVDVACDVVGAEGFRINRAKTRLMRSGQRQLLCGVVVNAAAAVRRDERDRLKAILHNCQRHGPESQNRLAVNDFRGHLLGRIAWVTAVNPAHGQALREQFDRIVW